MKLPPAPHCWRSFSPIHRKLPNLAALLAALGTSSFALHASAQPEADPFEDEFTVQRFNPAPGPRNFFTTRGARTDGLMTWSAGLMVNYAFEPFVVVSCVSRTNCDDAGNLERVPVVENLLTGDFMGTLTPIPRVQVGLRVPITWAKGQGITSEGTADFDNGIDAVGVGDAELEGKARFYGEPNDTMVLGGALALTGPLGIATAEGSYIGDNTPTVSLRGILDGRQEEFSFGVNLGAVLRGSGRVGSTEVGPEMRYGVAGGYQAAPVLRIVLDAFGSTRFTAQNGENPLELDGGLQIFPPGSPLSFSVGAGTALYSGVGAPVVRAFAGVMYTSEQIDADGDGVMDDADQCADQKEDLDGFEDSDGCPDPDNDGDTIADASDKCPIIAEDPDGFEDTDGCPEEDNDKDGIVDASDRCPTEAETKNGFKDQDGCPDEPDKDNDGVPDARDKCPDEAEDTDGFEDTDGCPDPDNDNDGVPDTQDECIDQPENKDGVQDEDGCPEGQAAPVAPPAKR